MHLPFTAAQFFSVITRYNETVWPLQIPLGLLPVAALLVVFVPRPWADRVISGILAFLWAWVGIAYQLVFFTAINPLAYAFASLSLAGAFVFAWEGVLRRRLAFAARRSARTVVALALIVFALVVYPLWATLAGHGYPELPTFGLPCPTTIFTIGMLMLAEGAGLRMALIAPVLWSLVGAQAAFLLDVPPDLGLVVAGIAGITLILRRPEADAASGIGEAPSVD
jgi:hypothetical protein